MRVYGAIAFDWNAERRTVVATTPSVLGVTPPAVIDLRDEWVCVGEVATGTMLVAWEAIRELSGWAPVEQDSSSAAEPPDLRAGLHPAALECPIQRPSRAEDVTKGHGR